jgi:ABC-type branched-subunit amino acid transport system ATPase component/ABC-type branched-subunit amino acid transport system permease subunit
MTLSSPLPVAASRIAAPSALRPAIAIVLGAVLLGTLPLFVNDYWVHIATLAGTYWVLVSGLDLVVGYGGMLAVGYVGLLTVGAYTASILGAKLNVDPFVGLAASAGTGLIAGLIVGLPALRLKHFYFAMTTLGFAIIVTQIALAWGALTGGGIGLAGPAFDGVFGSSGGFFALVLACDAAATWLVWNIASGNPGRALIAIRDADVAAEAVGVPIARVKLTVFGLSGMLAGVAGALFASVQSYITPDAFTLDLSVLFFIAVLIGGRGRVVGPLIGTALLTLLPEIAAPLVMWANFAYAALLLVVVLVAPGGIAELIERFGRQPGAIDRMAGPHPEAMQTALATAAPHTETGALHLDEVQRSFGGVRALDGVELMLTPGTVHGLIGPNGSGKTTALNIISGFYAPDGGHITIGEADVTTRSVRDRAALGIARTFQTPRILGELSVIENVMLGGYRHARAGFAEVALGLGRFRSDERALRTQAMAALHTVGLADWADARADRLQHSEQRFLEIARCLAMHPRFVLLDEPAAGLSGGEIEHLGAIIAEMRRLGLGVLLVEHHADFVFRICDTVTVLATGKVLAAGTPAEIRAHREVVNAYLGA